MLPEAEVETVVTYRVLPCLVRMCKKEETTNNRIIAAETLAYLIEVRHFLENKCKTAMWFLLRPPHMWCVVLLTLIINWMHNC